MAAIGVKITATTSVSHSNVRMLNCGRVTAYSRKEAGAANNTARIQRAVMASIFVIPAALQIAQMTAMSVVILKIAFKLK